MRLRVSLLPLYLAAAAISLIRAIIFFDESTISSLVGIVLVHDGRSVTASSQALSRSSLCSASIASIAVTYPEGSRVVALTMRRSGAV